MMPKRSKPSRPAREVLDPAAVATLASALAPAELSQAARDEMRRRIMLRVLAEAPAGTRA